MEAYTSINGSTTQKGNYLWGGALTLAWKQLSKQIIKEPIAIKSDKQDARQIAQTFNRCPFDSSMLSENCYYVKAGFGNQTVKTINEEVSKKFPEKTTAKLIANLPADGIISYAYFLKKMKFDTPFLSSQVMFKNKEVPGFKAKNNEQKKQIIVHSYTNDDNFIIELKTKTQNDHIFLIKSKNKLKPEQAIYKVEKLQDKGQNMKSKDLFEMPKISISYQRNVEELINVHLANQKFKKYFFSKIFQIIKLDIDETGIKVQNQGAITLKKSKKPANYEQPRKFILDKPFWIVMREKQFHPYFVAHIEELVDK